MLVVKRLRSYYGVIINEKYVHVLSFYVPLC
jgi:hypothetical protein